MDLPIANDQYAMKNYWNERYTTEADYDWSPNTNHSLTSLTAPLTDGTEYCS